MPYKLFAWSFVILSFATAASAKPRKKAQPAPVTSLTLTLGDKAESVTRTIGKSLVLRVSREHSASCARFGWNVEVTRSDGARQPTNLIYQNKNGHGPDASQVYAWHVSEGQFLRRRELPVKGYPYMVTLDLSDVAVTGKGAAACFDRATLTVSWQRRES